MTKADSTLDPVSIGSSTPVEEFEVASLKNPDYVRKFDRVIDDLQDVYSHKIRPLEKAYNFEHFSNSAPLGNDDIAAKPMVLLIGQYSTVSEEFAYAGTHGQGKKRNRPAIALAAEWKICNRG